MRGKKTTAPPSLMDRHIARVLEDSGLMPTGGRPRRYKPTEVADALRAEGGVATAAARRLGCDAGTVARYADRYATVRRAREEGLQMLRSLAEGVVLQALRQGDAQMARWVLRSALGGSEWREQPKAIEVAAGPDGAAQPVVVIPAQTFSSLEEWAKAARPVE